MPYNKRIELTARGRHAGCLRNRRAGDPPGFGLPAEPLRPCSQLIRALYGLSAGSRFRGAFNDSEAKNLKMGFALNHFGDKIKVLAMSKAS